MTNTQRKNIFSDGITYTRNLILRGISVIYLIAFVSFYYQSAGLFGNNGVAPARLQIDTRLRNILLNLQQKPTLLHFATFCGLDVESMLDVIALLGSLISFAGFVSQNVCTAPIFTILWFLYCSLMQVAQLFSNDTDYLLLEAGFILIMLAPMTRPNQASPSDKIWFVVLRWLLMRYIFATGASKFISRCPYWCNFTALHHYFETMPLPTNFAWIAHNYLASWLKLTNIIANLSELGCIWLFFFPHRAVRRYVFYWQVFLQVNIIATGNFGYINFMLPILMLSLLDDQFIAELTVKRLMTHALKVLVVCYLIFFLIAIIASPWVDNLKFEEFHLEILRKCIRPAPLIAAFVIISTFLINLVTHPAITHTVSQSNNHPEILRSECAAVIQHDRYFDNPRVYGSPWKY
ncbi:Lipase maturation factor 2 [Pseudolycoriella hygida]|uniref:Lipase maturation factor n=1 Tax=Pseudolycoriella hygida TaxID=35572 RepID=A0A9Q0RTP4_9DIPT|nr:Lipase maturation factor 2 [Pseudolycoriella hygida]